MSDEHTPPTSDIPIPNSISYTLREAARILNLDAKTLKHWLERAHMSASPDETDRRRKLLTQEQINILADLDQRPTRTVRPDGDLNKQIQEFDATMRQVLQKGATADNTLAQLTSEA